MSDKEKKDNKDNKEDTSAEDSYSFSTIIYILVWSFLGVLFSNLVIILFLKSHYNIFGLTKQVNDVLTGCDPTHTMNKSRINYNCYMKNFWKWPVVFKFLNVIFMAATYKVIVSYFVYWAIFMFIANPFNKNIKVSRDGNFKPNASKNLTVVKLLIYYFGGLFLFYLPGLIFRFLPLIVKDPGSYIIGGPKSKVCPVSLKSSIIFKYIGFLFLFMLFTTAISFLFFRQNPFKNAVENHLNPMDYSYLETIEDFLTIWSWKSPFFILMLYLCTMVFVNTDIHYKDKIASSLLPKSLGNLKLLHKKLKWLVPIFLSILTVYLILYNANISIFEDDEIKDQYKNGSIVGLYQAIVSYNYPCVPRNYK